MEGRILPWTLLLYSYGPGFRIQPQVTLPPRGNMPAPCYTRTDCADLAMLLIVFSCIDPIGENGRSSRSTCLTAFYPLETRMNLAAAMNAGCTNMSAPQHEVLCLRCEGSVTRKNTHAAADSPDFPLETSNRSAEGVGELISRGTLLNHCIITTGRISGAGL